MRVFVDRVVINVTRGKANVSKTVRMACSASQRWWIYPKQYFCDSVIAALATTEFFAVAVVVAVVVVAVVFLLIMLVLWLLSLLLLMLLGFFSCRWFCCSCCFHINVEKDFRTFDNLKPIDVDLQLLFSSACWCRCCFCLFFLFLVFALKKTNFLFLLDVAIQLSKKSLFRFCHYYHCCRSPLSIISLSSS